MRPLRLKYGDDFPPLRFRCETHAWRLRGSIQAHLWISGLAALVRQAET